MGCVGHPAGQFAQVGLMGGSWASRAGKSRAREAGRLRVSGAGRLQAGRQRRGGDPAQQFGDRRRRIDHLAGRHDRALGHRVANPDLDGIHAQAPRQLVHLGFIGETRLDGAETAHGPTRRIVRERGIDVDADVGNLIGPRAERGGVRGDCGRA